MEGRKEGRKAFCPPAWPLLQPAQGQVAPCLRKGREGEGEGEGNRRERIGGRQPKKEIKEVNQGRISRKKSRKPIKDGRTMEEGRGKERKGRTTKEESQGRKGRK